MSLFSLKYMQAKLSYLQAQIDNIDNDFSKITLCPIDESP